MSNFQQKAQGKSSQIQQFQSYSQTINKIYLNPYSLNNHTLLARTNKDLYDLHTSQIHKSSNTISKSLYQSILMDQQHKGFKSESMIAPQNTTYIQKKINGLSAARLTASGIFEQDQGWLNELKQPKKQEKPVINYFVTQFQRLKQQNQRLFKRLQQLQSKSQNSQYTQSSKCRLDLLQQNQRLKEELQIQKNNNREKNEKIFLLIDKVTRIQAHVEYILNGTKNIQNEDPNRMSISQQKFIKQKAVLKQQIQKNKIFYSTMINQSVNKVLQKIHFLQIRVIQLQDMYNSLQQKVIESLEN